MKTAAMMMMAALLGSMAWAAGKADGQKVVVCFEESEGNLAGVPQARMIAAELFQPAGVKLKVLGGRCSHGVQRDRVIVVTLATNTPRDLRPGALAYALPFEGVHIRVFYDRIANRADSRPMRVHLLAYVFVHEITHILEGMDRHSESGIMKATWTENERALMWQSRLRFAERDILLIHDGLAAWASHPASKTLVASAGLR